MKRSPAAWPGTAPGILVVACGCCLALASALPGAAQERRGSSTPSIFASGHPSSPELAVTTPEPGARPITRLLEAELADPSITRAADGTYYLTGTVRDGNVRGIHLWRSADLERWDSLGVVHDPGRVRAPEVHAIGAALLIVYAEPSGCARILRSRTGDGRGPYERSACLVEDAHDASLFADDDGSVYLLFGRGSIARLKPDLGGLADAPRYLKPHPSHFEGPDPPAGKAWPVRDRVGERGAFLFKHRGRYFLVGNEVTGRMGEATDDVFMAEARSVYGPYGPRYLAVPHAGQTTLFRDAAGRLLATLSGGVRDGYAVLRGRSGILPLTFSPEGRLRPDPSVLLEDSPVAHREPALDSVFMRDPSVTLGPDGIYYLVGTSSGQGYEPRDQERGLKLWRSPDLRRWEYAGIVWRWSDLGAPPRAADAGLWAPEIQYVRRDATFYLALSVWTGTGETYLFRSRSGRAEGPYENVSGSALVRGIDGFVFEDDDGVYFMWGNGRIGKLNAARSGFEGPPVPLRTVDGEHVGYEGNSLVKVGGRYVLAGAEWNGPLRTEGTYDMMYAVSDHLLGPYTRRRVGVPHAGHGTVFRDKEGNWWTTMFGNDVTAPWRTRFGLVPLAIQGELSVRGLDGPADRSHPAGGR